MRLRRTTQTDKDEERGRERERFKARQRSRERELDRDRERDGDRERACDRDSQCTLLTQRPSKQQNIELNKKIMRISDTRELCDFISTHGYRYEPVKHVQCKKQQITVSKWPLPFAKCFIFTGRGERSVHHALDRHP